jgi:hypothetical protein
MATKASIDHLVGTILALILIYVILGDIALFTVSFTILLRLLIEAVQTLERLLKAWEDEKRDSLARRIAIVTTRLHAQHARHIEALAGERALERRQRVEAETAGQTVRSQLEAQHAREVTLLKNQLDEAERGREAAENRVQTTQRELRDERDAGTRRGHIEDGQQSQQVVTVSTPVRNHQQLEVLPAPYSARLPQELLTLEPLSSGFTCIGVTKQKARCRQSMIGSDDKSRASTMLNSMRSSTPEAHLFEWEGLCNLATMLLCPRWHRKISHSQVDEIASRWFRLLEPAREALNAHNASTARQQLTRPPATPSPSSSSSSGSTFSIASATSSASSISAPSRNTSTSTTPLSHYGGNQNCITFGNIDHLYSRPAASFQDRVDRSSNNLTPAFQALARERQ